MKTAVLNIIQFITCLSIFSAINFTIYFARTRTVLVEHR